jgi:hypothetical protein
MKRTKMISSVTLIVFAFLALIAAINANNPPANPKWNPLHPGNLTFPLLRGGSTLVYANSNRIILFAGFSDDNSLDNPRLNDVWVLTHANGMGGTGTWSKLSPGGALPQVRYNHSAVYDAANNRMITYGGCGSTSGSQGCLPIADNVWVLSNANGLGGTPTWTQLITTGGPPSARQGHQAVYDPITNSMIVWAGQNGGGFFCDPDTNSEVWVLSNANGLGGTPNWTQLTTSGGPPAGQTQSTAVYDSSNNILMVFGGAGMVGTNCQPTNAVWALSHANGTGGTPLWTNLVAQDAAGSPANRLQHAAVYLPSTNTMTIFGGADFNGTLFGDTWVLSHANGLGGTPTWTSLVFNGTVPVESSRYNNGVIDTVNNRMIMFGGGTGGTGTDGPLWTTWVLTHPNGP